MDAMPDYNTISPEHMEVAQLTEVVSCYTTVNQSVVGQMQIQSMDARIMLKNIPITTDNFMIILLKTYYLDSTKTVCTLEVSHRERKGTTLPDVWSVSQETVFHTWV